MKKEAYCEASKREKTGWIQWGVAAVAVCLAVCGAIVLSQTSGNKPNPQRVQVINPMMEVGSLDEMEACLDFAVPVLDKEVEAYIVLVLDGYPEVGQVRYGDGSEFRVKYGEGDISGIYGGVLEKAVAVGDVEVSYYTYEATRYAIWEKDGFTYSFADGENLEEDVERLIYG